MFYHPHYVLKILIYKHELGMKPRQNSEAVIKTNNATDMIPQDNRQQFSTMR